MLAKSLQEATAAIKARPREPVAWLERAKILEQLAYPELSLGDCCKVRLLLESFNNENPSEDDRTLFATGGSDKTEENKNDNDKVKSEN